MAVEGKSLNADKINTFAPQDLMVLCNSFSFACFRPPEDGEGARSGEADPERDVGGGGAARRSGGSAGGAEASGEGGRQGPGGRHALQRLQPQLGLEEQ